MHYRPPEAAAKKETLTLPMEDEGEGESDCSSSMSIKEVQSAVEKMRLQFHTEEK